jgi:hypothetical protein
MKKFLTYIFLILFFSNISHAGNFRWTQGSETFDGNTIFYYDKNSVSKVGNYRYFWQLTDYRKDYDEDKSVISLTMIDCKISNLRWISYTGYTEHMARGNVTVDYILPEIDVNFFDWKYYAPDTAQGAVIKKVCKLR